MKPAQPVLLILHTGAFLRVYLANKPKLNTGHFENKHSVSVIQTGDAGNNLTLLGFVEKVEHRESGEFTYLSIFLKLFKTYITHLHALHFYNIYTFF